MELAEFRDMELAMDEAFREIGKREGELEGKRQTLLLLLQRRFGSNVTPAMAACVRKTVDHWRLDQWFDKILDARTLEEVNLGRTIAEALREEGELEGRLNGKRQMLLLMLDRKFGPNVMPAIVAGVEKMVDHSKLDQWAGKIFDAKTLEEVGIP